MYAKIINEETKQCEVGTGTNTVFYESIGMTDMDVEQGYDGAWYVKGYAPSKPMDVLAQEKRAERDNLLAQTDKYMLPDFPITEEKLAQYKAYRQYLRDLPEQTEFPNVDVLSFVDWTNSRGNENNNIESW